MLIICPYFNLPCCSCKVLHHELHITNQLMYINPSMDEARQKVLQELFAWEQVILTLSRIQHSRYQVCTPIMYCESFTVKCLYVVVINYYSKAYT